MAAVSQKETAWAWPSSCSTGASEFEFLEAPGVSMFQNQLHTAEFDLSRRESGGNFSPTGGYAPGARSTTFSVPTLSSATTTEDDTHFDGRSEEERKKCKRKLSNKNSARKSRQRKQDYADKLLKEKEKMSHLNADTLRELEAVADSYSSLTKLNSELRTEAIHLCFQLKKLHQAQAQAQPQGTKRRQEDPFINKVLTRYMGQSQQHVDQFHTEDLIL